MIIRSVKPRKPRKPCKPRYSFEYVKKCFSDRGYQLLSDEDEYTGVLCKLRYVCPRHIDKGEQKITFSKLHSCGQGCWYCAHEVTGSYHKSKLTKDDAVKLCGKKGFEFVSFDTVNHENIITFICPNHRELGEQEMKYQNMDRDIKGCKYCSGKKLPEWYVRDRIRDVNPDIDIVGKYVNLTTKVKCICRTHNREFFKTPQTLLMGQGCVDCGIDKVSKLSLNSLEYVQAKIDEVRDDIVVVEYNGHKKRSKFMCKEHGLYFDWYYQAILDGYGRCKKCKTHTMEDYVAKCLQDLGHTIERQKKYDDCVDKRCLPFDFYLPDLNILIEYDGKQHSEPRQFGSQTKEQALNSYYVTVRHDEIKNEYCRSKQIPLIRIPYTESSNIKEFVTEKIMAITASSPECVA